MEARHPTKGFGEYNSLEWHYNILFQIDNGKDVGEYVKTITGRKADITGELKHVKNRAMSIIREHLKHDNKST